MFSRYFAYGFEELKASKEFSTFLQDELPCHVHGWSRLGGLLRNPVGRIIFKPYSQSQGWSFVGFRLKGLHIGFPWEWYIYLYIGQNNQLNSGYQKTSEKQWVFGAMKHCCYQYISEGVC